MTSSNESESERSQSESVSPEVKQESSLQESPKTKVKAKGRAKGKRSSSKNRPKKRKLVRWNDDLDKEVLLTLQWACTESGIKIPWGMVAAQIGKDVSEGALVQHLSKLRVHMVNAKIDVPPLLRRGIPTREPSKIYALAGHKRKAGPFDVTSTPTRRKASSKVGTRSKSKRHMSEEDDSDEQPEAPPLLSDSEEEYGSRKKKRVRASRAKPKTLISKAESLTLAKRRTSAIENDSVETGIQESVEQADVLPARRTRGIKQDFSSVLADDGELSNEEEPEEEEAQDGESDDEEPAEVREMSVGIDNSRLLSPNPAIEFSFAQENAKALKKATQQGVGATDGSHGMAAGVRGASWIQRIPGQQVHIPTGMFNPSFSFGNGQLSNGVHSYQNMMSDMTNDYDVTPPIRNNGSFSSQSGLSSRTPSYPTDFDTFMNTNAMAIQAPVTGPQIHDNGFMMNMPGPLSYNGDCLRLNEGAGMFGDLADADDEAFGGHY